MMTRARRVAAAAIVLAMLAVLYQAAATDQEDGHGDGHQASVAALQAGHDARPPASTRSVPEPTGIFNVVCDYSHTKNDDPIAMPGMPGQAMRHDFVGSRVTDASSTGETLLGTPTTCTSAKDPSAYWVPALRSRERTIRPDQAKIYYESTAGNHDVVKPFPVGLQMIVGDKAGSQPHTDWTVWFSCVTGGGTAAWGPSQKAPATCPAGSRFQVNLRFPDCWDGKTLEGGARANVAYSGSGGCPAAHPVAFARLIMHVRYPVSGALSPLSLSIEPGTWGSVYTAHADFINAWNPRRQAELVRDCLEAQVKCGTIRD